MFLIYMAAGAEGEATKAEFHNPH